MTEPVETRRYEAAQAINGSWRVLDLQTGRPAEINGIMQLGMELQDAQRLADKMSSDARRRRKTV